MITEIKAAAVRSADTLIEDALGVIAVFGLLLAGLALPGLF